MQKIKTILIILFLGVCASATFAQQGMEVRGIIYKKNTPDRVADVLITDMNTHVVVISSDLGIFKIKASIGDTLMIDKVDYGTQKIAVVNTMDIAVYLQPVIHLDNVTIKSQSKQQELNSIMNDYHSKGVFYNGKPPVMSAIFSPVNGLYSLIGKGPAQARRFAKYSEKETEALEDKRKYNKEIVKKVTNMSDEEIQKFMDTYTPLHEDLMKWNDYEVIKYIKTSYENYKKNGAVPLQKLY